VERDGEGIGEGLNGAGASDGEAYDCCCDVLAVSILVHTEKNRK
jgi:hypothetical protein